ncbi:formylglycine-generating enzyme family protein [Verrucomicrobia bacterium]|nr:formylglycine-generating enzyme family protein [Verrucomicrobiota bacterium]MDC0323977.1 formylglycine-generating enzyme family protein [Verrucomicrobiota bacterium]
MNHWKHIFVGLCGVMGLLALAGCGPSTSNEQTSGSTNASSGMMSFPVKTASGIEMIFLGGDTFTMGSDQESSDEGPAHKVTLSPFLIDQYEVTHEQFAKVQIPNPSHWQDDPRKPVEQLRWRDAKLYCNERSLLEGLTPCYDEAKEGWPCNYEANGYRLPSEAEWEFAARAGSKDGYPVGKRALNQSAWFGDNAGKQTHVVGTRRPNDWGIHDMYGNVSEWCQDAYEEEYYASSLEKNPRGPADTAENNRRVMRGGSWKSSADMCRVTFRQGQQTGDSDACFYTDFCGFRCVRSISEEDAKKLVSDTSSE